MEALNRYVDKVNHAITLISYPSAPEGLYEPIKYIMSLGGKRIRPALVLMSYEMFGGKSEEEVLPAAVGLEIFHNFTLLHDDVMDKAAVRRGKPTVHCVWSENTAILSGDVMQIMAYREMMKSPAFCLKDILDLFSTTAIEICEGQQYDMEFENRENVTEEEYLEMIRLKTAVLLGCALKMGAVLSCASVKDAELVYDFGVNLGLAFQLKDDWLDVYGNPEVFGKNIGGDIVNNKKTYLLISALKKSRQKKSIELEQWIKCDAFDQQEKIEAVTALYSQYEVDKDCMKLMEHYYQLALDALEKLTIGNSSKKILSDLAAYLMNREV